MAKGNQIHLLQFQFSPDIFIPRKMALLMIADVLIFFLPKTRAVFSGDLKCNNNLVTSDKIC